MVDLIVFGYVGRGATNATREGFAELAERLGRALVMDVAVFEATSYADLSTATMTGYVDIAWLPPIPFLRLHSLGAVVPLVAHERRGKTQSHSAVIVASDSPFSSLATLSGARAAWVDKDSASGYVLPRVRLAEAGLDPRVAFSSERFFGSHDAVVRAITAGRADFGATYAGQDSAGNITRGPWSEGHPEVPTNVRVLAHFGPIPGDTTAARIGLAPLLRERIATTLKTLSQARPSRALFRRVFGIDELTTWVAGDHDELRQTAELALKRGIIDVKEGATGSWDA